MFHLAPDVNKRFHDWVYPAPLVCIILFEWISNGLSLVVQGILQADSRMAAPVWFYHRKLDFMPGGASLWWGILWVAVGLFVLYSVTVSIKALMYSLVTAGGLAFVTAFLFFAASLRDSSVSFSGATHYVTFGLLATTAGLFLQAKANTQIIQVTEAFRDIND